MLWSSSYGTEERTVVMHAIGEQERSTSSKQARNDLHSDGGIRKLHPFLPKHKNSAPTVVIKEEWMVHTKV